MTLFRRMLTNHPLVNILFLVIVVMGILSFISMPREQDPEISFNWLQVTTTQPGASAEDIEELITGPLEDAVRSVQSLSFVSTQSSEGLSSMLIRLEELDRRTADKRIADLRREIQAKFNEELPDDANDPEVVELDTSSGFPTALVVVAGQADDEVLRSNSRRIQLDLERFKGIDRVTAFGLHEPELLVSFDPEALALRNIRATAIADTLRDSFRNVSAGSVDIGDGAWLVRVEELTSSPDKLADLEIGAPGSQDSVRLGDVARIEQARKDPSQLVRYRQQPAVTLAVTKVANTNTIDLIEDISAYVARNNALLEPVGLEVLIADDQTIATSQALSVMETNSLLGLALVLLVCWAFLGLRIAAMVTLGIVFSIAGTFWVLKLTGNTLNVSVLLGVVIVLGMLVDDAVVVVEAIYYRLQRGESSIDSALGALGEVGTPVTAAVLTTISAFLPLMLLPGIIGQFMFVIPFVVTVGLLISLVEAFWVLPAHVIGLGGHAITDGKVQRIRERITRKVRLRYAKMLTWVIRRPIISSAAGLVIMLVAATLIASGAIKNEFFTFDPVRLFYVHFQMPPDSRLEDTLAAAEQTEKRLMSVLTANEARAVTVQAGLLFTETEALIGDQYAQIQVSLNPKKPGGRSVAEIVQATRAALADMPTSAEINFLEMSGGPPREPPVKVKVRGDNFEVISEAADRVQEIVASIPGVRDIRDNEVLGRRQLVIDLQESQIRAFGLAPAEVSRLLRLHTDGEIVSTLRSSGEKIELRVRAEEASLDRIEAILDTPIALPDGSQTTFRPLVGTAISRGRGVIQHYNFRRIIQVTAEISPGTTDTIVANQMIVDGWAKISEQYPEIDLDFTGALDDIQESLNAMLPLGLFGIGLIYLLLATQFRSYFQPLLILLTVPMSVTGVILGLWITNNPISLYTIYGTVALVGIAVNAAIVLIDAANRRIASGMRPLHATISAARRRVIPILMTTSTTIAGLFSLAVGLGGKSLLWGPVATSIVSGLLVASTLTLFLVPMLYRFFMRGRTISRS